MTEPQGQQILLLLLHVGRRKTTTAQPTTVITAEANNMFVNKKWKSVAMPPMRKVLL